MWSRADARPHGTASARAEFAAELSDAEQTATVSTLRADRSHRRSTAGPRGSAFVDQTRTSSGALHEVLRDAAGRQRRQHPDRVQHARCCSRGCAPASCCRARRRSAGAARCWPPTARCWPRARSLSTPIPEVAERDRRDARPDPGRAGDARTRQQGYPPNARVGVDGLEEIFQRRLAGRLGGELLAGTRVLAKARPGHGATVRTTIEPGARAGRASPRSAASYAGITVMNPRTGAIEAAAGIAFSDVQPPGSTFKIITAAAALQAGLTTPSTTYPYESSIVLDGFKMQNAGGEVCGGTLTNAFANSCDTTFAPLGAQLGAPEAGGDGRALRLRPADRARRRAREHDPVGRPDRRSAWPSAPRRSARASCRPARSRWPTSPRRSPTAAAGRSRRCSTAREPRFVRVTTREGRRRGPADDGGRRRRTGPAPPRRSRASRSPARPAPPS